MGQNKETWREELQRIANLDLLAVKGQSRANEVDESNALEQQIELDKKQAELDGIRNDIHARRTYGIKIFRMVQVWLIGVFFLLLFQGFFSVDDRESYIPFFRLESSVLIAVVSGTTASVLGIFVIVANYFFPKKGP